MSWYPAPDRYENMQYRHCGKSGLRLPALSLGLWHSFGHVQPLDAQRALLRKAFDLGITHFDLANNYGPPAGSAEENFGRLLREDFAAYRDELVISTKAGYDMWPGPYGSGGSRKYLLASLDQSLKRLGVDYVDIFYSHRVDETTPMEETASALAQARTGVNVLLPGETLLQPYATIGWDQTKANGFSDSEVTFADSQVSSWNGGAGVRLTTTLRDLNKNVKVMPWIDARFQKEFSDDTDIQAADYHNTSGHNNTMGIFGAGINATIAHNFTLTTGVYVGTGDVDNDASVQAGMSYSF